jgi:hypothetical protein
MVWARRMRCEKIVPQREGRRDGAWRVQRVVMVDRVLSMLCWVIERG